MPRRWSSKAVGAFSKRGYTTTPESSLSLVIAVALVAGVVASLVCANVAGGIAVAVCCIGAFVVWVNTQHDRSADELRESVPDVLRSFESCFQAGQSLVQTFDLQAASTQGPLKEVFAEAAQVLHTGGSTARALECLRKVAQIPEMAFVAVALDVQHQTGGSMQQVLAATRSVVEDEIDLARSMRVQTAQARLSARVVSLMPVALIAVFSLISENFLGAFFESLTGMALLGTAIAMQLAGILLVRRMLEVA